MHIRIEGDKVVHIKYTRKFALFWVYGETGVRLTGKCWSFREYDRVMVHPSVVCLVFLFSSCLLRRICGYVYL